MKLSKIYLEITNVCNLACSFCHGTKRSARFMTYEEFISVITKIKGKADYLYFHLMGEPFLHGDIEKMAKAAHECGFQVMLTTNGTLLSECASFVYLKNYIKKVSISLHSLDMTVRDGDYSLDERQEKYLSDCADFAKKCAGARVICALRLWNLEKGMEHINDEIIRKLHEYFPDEWIENRSGYKLYNAPKGEKEVFLEFGEKFDWPDCDGKERKTVFCHGLRRQIGILCDGSVVPCCLDADGAVTLGNIFESELSDVLSSQRAKRLISSFDENKPCEKLCKSCGFGERFSGM